MDAVGHDPRDSGSHDRRSGGPVHSRHEQKLGFRTKILKRRGRRIRRVLESASIALTMGGFVRVVRLIAVGLYLVWMCASGQILFAQAGEPDWPNYGNDAGGMRHSPLAQINRE